MLLVVSHSPQLIRFSIFQYHQKGIENDFQKLAPTSSSIGIHIEGAYLQCYRWGFATDANIHILNPVDHGYELQDEHLVPTAVSEPTMPDDFPHPRTCVKCFQPKMCPCRIANIKCCDFCRCEGCRKCHNPNNMHAIMISK